MEIAILMLLMFIVAGGVVAWLWRPGARVALPAPAETGRKANPYHCVAMCSGTGTCEAVKKLDGKRFFSAEAPPLPLPDCDAK